MADEFDFNYIKYLRAKEHVDDRALYGPAWGRLGDWLAESLSDGRSAGGAVREPVRLVDVGCGIGSVFYRLLPVLLRRMRAREDVSTWRPLEYVLVDVKRANLEEAVNRCSAWARAPGADGAAVETWCADSRAGDSGDLRNDMHGATCMHRAMTGAPTADRVVANVHLQLPVHRTLWQVYLQAWHGDACQYCAATPAQAHVLIAAAFFDLFLVDATAAPADDTARLASVLRCCLQVLRSGGLFYFPIHYNGVTGFAPTLPDAANCTPERPLLERFHATMGASTRGRSGDALRRLLTEWQGAHRPFRVRLLETGRSDWRVVPSAEGGEYASPADAYFLRCILFLIASTCRATAKSEADTRGVDSWYRQRLAAVDDGVLAYTAENVDMLGVLERTPD